ncbi:lysine N(6)-hydroxylase/L-ornithine N(5)-oxygenase family protein [Streptomyces sp. 5-8]|uniref:L-lysine N6-monooxygenase MbtG n=1 Tax=Streptomyces musisoli TaxID=2802280 RepID=A0ABS1P9Q4_9ACTN|nr:MULTISPECIES: lysine N(6)-hydroxylase/L-ornithine N(5)-oxygenase family protein [Streptomyces]MBL1109083.1 lysine N(6)-hydroxylase/L-ornithine N(5)-oxygenase family protein [Streptomyces musisoli]MBY8842630.1 lysine N(6)-hydroxylase/L-ornithine N(5)-oxygenase family protein [Streptomyces sp. SP2-10]
MPEAVLDLVGVGFGPSNLAVALALDEAGAPAGCDALFLERQPAFGWHTGMLLDEATMQVSFLKDLVTMRNPASPHSYLCYLRDRGRLAAFINQKSLFPLRTEFHDYLAWCAERVGHLVRYGAQVVDIRPVPGPDGAVDLLDVVVHRDGAEEVHRTRNVVIAAGLQPWLPDGIERSDRVWHTSELLHRLPEFESVAPRSLTVVGAGQSAAEAVAHLHGRFPEAEVRAVFGRYGYSPADDSPFANQIFDPDAVDEYYVAPEHVRRRLVDYHRNTNYAVVDLELIQDLYARSYREQVRGTQPRLVMMNVSRLASLSQEGDAVRLVVEHLPTGELTEFETDAVVFGTGYRPADPLALLGSLADQLKLDDQSRPHLDRDYRLVTTDRVRAGIYVQGPTEHTHGLASTLLSVTAVRAGEILAAVTAAVPAQVLTASAR